MLWLMLYGGGALLFPPSFILQDPVLALDCVLSIFSTLQVHESSIIPFHTINDVCSYVSASAAHHRSTRLGSCPQVRWRQNDYCSNKLDKIYSGNSWSPFHPRLPFYFVTILWYRVGAMFRLFFIFVFLSSISGICFLQFRCEHAMNSWKKTFR